MAAPRAEAPGKAVFEIVLGNGLIFAVEDSFDYSDDIKVTPTTSVYLTGELFVSPRWRISFGYELRSTSTATALLIGSTSLRASPRRVRGIRPTVVSTGSTAATQ